jgi:hypothetical protein
VERHGVTLSVSVQFPAPEPPPTLYKGWRGLYRIEGGNDHEWNQPAVIPTQYNGRKDSFGVPFTKEMQFLSWDLTQKTNALMTSMDWTHPFKGDVMLCNNNGWDSKNTSDQRRDYVNNRYASWPDPKLMDGLVNAGCLIHMEENDGHLWGIPGISGIDVNKPLPTVDEVIRRGWYFRVTVNQVAQDRGQPYDFPNGHGQGVYVPYFLIKETPYDLNHFERWEADSPPDPLRVYNV